LLQAGAAYCDLARQLDRAAWDFYVTPVVAQMMLHFAANVGDSKRAEGCALIRVKFLDSLESGQAAQVA
jgi:hypothetical protein